MSDKKLTYLEEADVETQVFEWGRLAWLSEPRVTAAERFSAGVVTLEPGKGHDRHNHPGVEEILYVLEGTGEQMVETDMFHLLSSDAVKKMVAHVHNEQRPVVKAETSVQSGRQETSATRFADHQFCF